MEIKKLADIEVHSMAHLTPTMTQENFNALKLSIQDNGQELPIVLYRGACIDGRHRIKAMRELGMENIKTINEDSTMSLDDIRNKVLNVYECRRHETPTQKAIMAYREWSRLKSIGEKIGQGVVADMFGTTVKQLGRAKQLHTKAGDEILESLFQGNKLNIGTSNQPMMIDSLSSLINYFNKHTDEILAQTELTNISEDFTDEEDNIIELILGDLKAQLSDRMLKRLNSVIYSRLEQK